MTDELTQAAMTTWAAKDLPARLLAAQVAKLLHCTPEDVAILVTAGKLRHWAGRIRMRSSFSAPSNCSPCCRIASGLMRRRKPLANTGSERMLAMLERTLKKQVKTGSLDSRRSC